MTREEKAGGFVADAMLGRLARWLRVLGYDTLYRSSYPPGSLAACLGSGRRLVTRQPTVAAGHPGALLLSCTRVGEQLSELLEKAAIRPSPELWFSRCLVCNHLLERAPAEQAQENVPEYVYYHDHGQIRCCSSCGRYYWPGTHRSRMIRQLHQWGLVAEEPAPSPAISSPASVQGNRCETEKT